MRSLNKAALALTLGAALAAAWFAYFSSHPLTLPATPYEFEVKPGASLKTLSRSLADEGLLPEAHSFWILGRALGKAASIQAGVYRLDKPATPLELLDKLSRGNVVAMEMMFVEGSTWRQWFAQLAQNPRIRANLAGKTEAQIRSALGVGGEPLEGAFFPDTYRFAPGASDVEILKRAHATMQRKLAEAWAARDAGLALASAQEALILASIVEKETALPSERPLVASVFLNRLKRGMRLQTDPTVIYGMGESFEGNIRKKDLL
ncbi:MAG TPA: endolytic transglycosylase MltG, partial [Usitatibacter sp.]|nr:endolytic transglycosylase MltG [Usitatibacter sp.]